MLTPAIRSDIRNLVRRLDGPRAPTNWKDCWYWHCRYVRCTIRRNSMPAGRGGVLFDGRPCPLYRREGE